MNATGGLLMLLLFPTPVFAGTIFGSLRVDGAPVGRGVQVQISCEGGEYRANTDEYGAYDIHVPNGRCKLVVHFKGETPPYQILSADDPARYDFDLVYDRNRGHYVLKRR